MLNSSSFWSPTRALTALHTLPASLVFLPFARLNAGEGVRNVAKVAEAVGHRGARVGPIRLWDRCPVGPTPIFRRDCLKPEPRRCRPSLPLSLIRYALRKRPRETADCVSCPSAARPLQARPKAPRAHAKRRFAARAVHYAPSPSASVADVRGSRERVGRGGLARPTQPMTGVAPINSRHTASPRANCRRATIRPVQPSRRSTPPSSPHHSRRS